MKQAIQTLVTGGSGFVGRRVADRLVEEGHDVFIVDVGFRADTKLKGAAVDIRQRDALIDVFSSVRPTFVCHLAGIADARRALKDPTEATSVNAAGTAAVLDAAVHANVEKVVIASSAWVDSALAARPATGAPFRPSGGGHVYTTTMITRELLAHDFWALHGQKFTILRYSPLYGPGMWPGLAIRSFLEAGARGGPIIVHGDGATTRRYLHVDDLADAFVRCCMSDKAANETFAIRGPDAVRVVELAKLVAELFGGLKISFQPAPERRGELPDEEPVSDEDAEKVRALLGWQPKTRLKEGLAALVEEYSEGVYV